jgi:hypothetical protein
LKVVESSKADGYWRLKVELSRDEVSLISTVFGIDICSTEYISVDELTRRLLHGIIANRLRESRGGCEVSMIVSSVWLQSIAPAGSYVGEEKQLLEYMVEGLGLTFNTMTSLARGLEELRRRLVAPCIDPRTSTSLNQLLEELPLLCVRGYTQERSQVLEVIAGDNALPNYSLKLSLRVNALPDALVKTWYRGLQSKLEGCIRVESESKDTMYIGGVRFKSGYYYVNDCVILDAYIRSCKERVTGKTAGTAKLEDLKLGERSRNIVDSFLRLVGRDNVEVRVESEWLCFRSLKLEDPLEEAGLCLGRRASLTPLR